MNRSAVYSCKSGKFIILMEDAKKKNASTRTLMG